MVSDALPDIETDADMITCLRSTLMKPEQTEWVPRIVEILEAVAPR